MKVFRFCSYISVWFFVLSLEATADNNKIEDVCRIRFGTGVTVSFEPFEANYGVSVIHSVLGNSKVKEERKEAKKPTAYRCASVPTKKLKCPKGLRFDSTRKGSLKCISDQFDLKDLCETEIPKYWPELKREICEKH